ncbi:SufE protein probably involved in Fe-S center assembly [Sanguibacter keddieii DSM 10542]|uniref:SufE protein probably involved in Fe-S center assembly n=1 Tax=Sanguibacter keddieii (strain ATCC 51767 / DSM 10542 / NCFB 3025 / ST-74) TaxID=446469 RepID=D1BGL9_SANKS|nr:SufE family protein [Sanguibacter keddieii]ACZ21596.1 SufE protein probably involved in Fe-S center assembly [Sanguibacter keddieii DSM 10542]
MSAPTPSIVPLPAALAELVEDFQAMPEAQRLELLVEMGDSVAEVPERYTQDLSTMEQVVECQSPVYVAVEVADDAPHTVTLHVLAPKEAPTTRGFAGVLSEGLAGCSADEVLALPHDVPARLGLDALVSPLRLAGMASMQGRIQRQVLEQLEARGVEARGVAGPSRD